MKRESIKSIYITKVKTIILHIPIPNYSQIFQEFDYFGSFKRRAFKNSTESYVFVARTLTDFTETKTSKKTEEKGLFFRQLLKVINLTLKLHNVFLMCGLILGNFKLNLWGNRCDLSISKGVDVSQSGDPLAVLESLEPHILADDTQDIWECVSQGNEESVVGK